MGSASARLRRGGRSPTELYAVAWGEWFSLENCSLHLSIYTAEANDGGPSNCYGLVRDNSPVERSTWNNLGVRAHFLVCVLRCHLWLKDTHLLAVRVSIHWMTHLGLFEWGSANCTGPLPHVNVAPLRSGAFCAFSCFSLLPFSVVFLLSLLTEPWGRFELILKFLLSHCFLCIYWEERFILVPIS